MPRMSRAERRAGLKFARNWRIANKPYFDALYGPETTLEKCPTCGTPNAIEVPK